MKKELFLDLCQFLLVSPEVCLGFFIFLFLPIVFKNCASNKKIKISRAFSEICLIKIDISRGFYFLLFCSSSLLAKEPSLELQTEVEIAINSFLAKSPDIAKEKLQALLEEKLNDEERAVVLYNLGTIDLRGNNYLGALSYFDAIDENKVESSVLRKRLIWNRALTTLRQAKEMLDLTPQAGKAESHIQKIQAVLQNAEKAVHLANEESLSQALISIKMLYAAKKQEWQFSQAGEKERLTLALQSLFEAKRALLPLILQNPSLSLTFNAIEGKQLVLHEIKNPEEKLLLNLYNTGVNSSKTNFAGWKGYQALTEMECALFLWNAFLLGDEIQEGLLQCIQAAVSQNLWSGWGFWLDEIKRRKSFLLELLQAKKEGEVNALKVASQNTEDVFTITFRIQLLQKIYERIVNEKNNTLSSFLQDSFYYYLMRLSETSLFEILWHLLVEGKLPSLQGIYVTDSKDFHLVLFSALQDKLQAKQIALEAAHTATNSLFEYKTAVDDIVHAKEEYIKDSTSLNVSNHVVASFAIIDPKTSLLFQLKNTELLAGSSFKQGIDERLYTEVSKGISLLKYTWEKVRQPGINSDFELQMDKEYVHLGYIQEMLSTSFTKKETSSFKIALIDLITSLDSMQYEVVVQNNEEKMKQIASLLEVERGAVFEMKLMQNKIRTIGLTDVEKNYFFDILVRRLSSLKRYLENISKDLSLIKDENERKMAQKTISQLLQERDELQKNFLSFSLYGLIQNQTLHEKTVSLLEKILTLLQKQKESEKVSEEHKVTTTKIVPEESLSTMKKDLHISSKESILRLVEMEKKDESVQKEHIAPAEGERPW